MFRFGGSQFSPQLVVLNTGPDTVVLRRATLGAGREFYAAALRGDATSPYLIVPARSTDSLTLSWTEPTYTGFAEPLSIWLVFEVGDTTRTVRAVLDMDEFRAHPARRRARIARFGAAIFLTGILTALFLRRERERKGGGRQEVTA